MRGAAPGAGAIAIASALTGILFAGPGCNGREARAPFAPPPPREVGFTLRDAAFRPLASESIFVGTRTAGSGFTGLAVATDSAGTARLTLVPDAWIASASTSTGDVAGGGFVVPQGPVLDTLLVRLTAVAPSRAGGRAVLAGRSDHRNIRVGAVGTRVIGLTDSTGAYDVDGLPPGRWTLAFDAPGFATGLAEAHVQAPGTAVTVPDVTLISAP